MGWSAVHQRVQESQVIKTKYYRHPETKNLFFQEYMWSFQTPIKIEEECGLAYIPNYNQKCFSQTLVLYSTLLIIW